MNRPPALPGVTLTEASSPPNFLVGNPNSFEPITMDLTVPTDFIQVTLISVGHMVLTTTAFAPDLLTVLDSISVTNPLGPPDGLNNKDAITLNGPGISRVLFEITVPAREDGFGIDDVSFEMVTPAPAPGTGLLLAGWVPGLLVWNRRRGRPFSCH